MADNVAITPGTGATIAADDIGGVLHQRVKLSLGADGTANDASAGAGAVGTGTQRVTLASDDPGVALLTTINSSLDAIEASNAAIQVVSESTDPVHVISDAGTAHIGQVGSPLTAVDVTFSMDASLHASGEVLADTQEIAAAVRVSAGYARLDQITLLDEDDLGLAMDLVFLSANNSIGTESGALSISDANAREILGTVNVATTDYVDMGGMRVATVKNIGLLVKGASASTSIYVGIITRGTPTPTASGLRGRFFFLQG